MIRTSRTQFWYLFGLGLWGLWGLAFFDGMFDRLDIVLRDNMLLDGRQLRNTYTGNAFIDKQLTLLSVFYGTLSDSKSSAPRLLFFDINFVVACTNLWVLIESRRRGVTNIFLRYPIWIIILWNANGAAIFQPPYFYLLTRCKGRQRDPSIPLNDAIALFILTLPTMLCPLLLFLPAWLGWSHWDHQGYIARFQYLPVILSGLFFIITSVAPRTLSEKVGRQKRQADFYSARKFVVASLILAGTIAAIVHIYAVLGAFLAKDVDLSLTRLFIPSHHRNIRFPHWTDTLKPSDEYSALLENFHLFSQYDWIVVSLSSILFTHLLLCKRDGLERDLKVQVSRNESRDLMYLALATLLLGPGAAGSFALAIKESTVTIQESNMEKSEKVNF